MKTIKLMLASLALILLTACSSTGYNPDLCKNLSEKIQNDQTLSESDYNDMIDQVGAICKHLDEMDKKAGNDESQKETFKSNESVKEEATYLLGFAIYLEMNKDKLTEDNVKKMESLQKEMKSLKL